MKKVHEETQAVWRAIFMVAVVLAVVGLILFSAYKLEPWAISLVVLGIFACCCIFFDLGRTLEVFRNKLRTESYWHRMQVAEKQSRDLEWEFNRLARENVGLLQLLLSVLGNKSSAFSSEEKETEWMIM